MGIAWRKTTHTWPHPMAQEDTASQFEGVRENRLSSLYMGCRGPEVPIYSYEGDKVTEKTIGIAKGSVGKGSCQGWDFSDQKQ